MLMNITCSVSSKYRKKGAVENIIICNKQYSNVNEHHVFRFVSKKGVMYKSHNFSEISQN